MTWAVRVDDVRIQAVNWPVLRWWTLFQLRMPEERIRWESMGLGGGVAHVLCDSKQDAEWLATHMESLKAPKGCVKVVTLP